MDYVLYHQLFDIVRPKTVIELGTLSGAMAIWMANTLGFLGVESHIYSMDLDPSNQSEIVNKLKPENVTFLQGDSYEVEKTFTDEFLKAFPIRGCSLRTHMLTLTGSWSTSIDTWR